MAGTHELLQAVRVLYGAMHRFEQGAARMLGVAAADLRCMNALEKGPRSPSDLARELGLTRGATTSLLDRLERLRFIERLRVEGDRRMQQVRLLPAAYEQAGAVYGRLGESMARRLGGKSARSRAAVRRAVLQVAEAFDEAAETGQSMKLEE